VRGELVGVWSADVVVDAIGTKIGPAVVIGEDDENVGAVSRVYGTAEGNEDAADNRKSEDFFH
jgi:hypothetical protein